MDSAAVTRLQDSFHSAFPSIPKPKCRGLDLNNPLYRSLVVIAASLTLVWLSWTIYDTFWVRTAPGDYAYYAGSHYFADGYYEKALNAYNQALAANPYHLPALRGRAEALIMLSREHEAIATYDRLIALEPKNAGHYANRGIAHDRQGEHEKALIDYRKSLNLDPEIGKGPNWLVRFLRNQPEKIHGISGRARYIAEQLTLPSSKRLLQVPKIDHDQIPYKY